MALSSRVGLIVVLGLAILAAPAGLQAQSSQPQDILDLVPADAWGFLLLGDVKATGDKLDKYVQQLSIPQPVELGKLLSSQIGVDISTGPLAIVVLNKTLYGQEPYLVIFAVPDYDLFSKALSAQPSESAGISKVILPEEQNGYVARNGRFVLLTANETALKAVMTSKYSVGKLFGAAQRKRLASSEVFCRVNLQALVPTVKPYLMMFGLMAGGMGSGMLGMPGMSEPGAESKGARDSSAGMMHMVNAFVGLLDQLGNLDLTGNIEPDGIRLTVSLSFRPGSQYAQRMNAQKSTDKPLLTGLPGSDFLVAWACNWLASEPTQFELAMLDASPITDPIVKDKFRKLSIEKLKLSTGTKAVVRLNKSVKPGQGMLEAGVIITVSNAQRYLKVNRELIQMQETFKVNIPGQEIPEVKVQYLPAAEKLGDLTVDHVVMDFGALLGMLQNFSPGQPDGLGKFFELLMGNRDGKLLYRLAVVDSTTVCIGLGGGLEDFGKLVKSHRTKNSSLAKSPAVGAIAAKLPKQRMGQLYFNIGNALEMAPVFQEIVGGLTGGIGQLPFGLGGAGNLPLVGVSVTCGSDALSAEIFVPTKLVSRLMNAAKTAAPSQPAGTQPEQGAAETTRPVEIITP